VGEEEVDRGVPLVSWTLIARVYMATKRKSGATKTKPGATKTKHHTTKGKLDATKTKSLFRL
jgi:hypothetical protein